MEDSLGPNFSKGLRCLVDVLILVVMEDSLGRDRTMRLYNLGLVLILVVMEDSLRQRMSEVRTLQAVLS